MRDELGIPLEVHNDANLAALGEYTYGVGAGSRLFAYILIGTGLGMGVVSEGRLFTGAHGGAGEIGFLPWPGRQKPETLEDAVSGVAVVESARAFGMSGQLTAKAVFDAARQGHPAAVRAVQLEGERIAHTVGGGRGARPRPRGARRRGGPQCRSAAAPRTGDIARPQPLRPKIAPSRLGEDAVLLGALATGGHGTRRCFERARVPDRAALPS